MYIPPVYIASIVCQDESPFIVGRGTNRMLEADTKIEISRERLRERERERETLRERDDHVKML